MDGQNGTNGKDGEDGQSAYDLWIEKVKEGLLNPHDENGGNWPDNKTSVSDFWEYLRGKDGKDGVDGQDGKPGDPGKPGEQIPVEIGKFNVIAQYVDQKHAEYVRWLDGAVLYTVHDKEGKSAPGAQVSGMPGVSDPSKVYTANKDGEFLVSKDELPKDKSHFGSTASVTYNGITEKSAENTYVPTKVDVRLRINDEGNNMPFLALETFVKLTVERRLSTNHSWDPIPSYLGEIEQTLYAIEINDSDINPHTGNSVWNMTVKANLSNPTNEIRLKRPLKNNDYIRDEHKGYIWKDDKDRIVHFKMESYYGESPEADKKVKLAPVQFIPHITDLKRGDILRDKDNVPYVSKIRGRFNIGEFPIDYNLMFKERYVLNGDTYVPVKEEKDIVVNEKFMGIKFEYKAANEEQSSVVSNNYNASIANPAFDCNLPYIDSKVVLVVKDGSRYFYPYWGIGYLREDKVEKEANFPDVTIVKE